MKPKSFKPNNSTGVRVFNGKQRIDNMYKGDWAKYSKEFLKVNTKCYCCGQRSEAVDHIKVHLGDRKLFWERENHIPLCHRCHNTITGKFDRKIPQDLSGKMKYLFQNRQRNDLNFAVLIVPFYTRESLDGNIDKCN